MQKRNKRTIRRRRATSCRRRRHPRSAGFERAPQAREKLEVLFSVAARTSSHGHADACADAHTVQQTVHTVSHSESIESEWSDGATPSMRPAEQL